MVVTDERNKTFDKFVDYLYHDITPWMKILAKCPPIQEKYTKNATRRLIKESSFYIEENVKIERGPFSNF